MSSTNGKPLRFASLIRVSTEKQERHGESLTTQRKQIERDVERLSGTVADWYGGQEHATPGWERKELDRLLADAVRGKFDAVMVAYADRWSRDNAKSKEGLELFRKHGVRFFVGSMEMNLFDPQHGFMLGMNAEVGEFIALQTSKKSLESRIERLRKGIPAVGKIPFGRTYTEKQGWGLDPVKVAMITDVATRYVQGEAVARLAEEYGVKRCQLTRILREDLGDQWTVRIRSPRLAIDESVTLTIPRLLDEKTVQEVKLKLLANRTYAHRPPKVVHTYLLGGMVFCAHCGYTMTGTNKGPWRYYRHNSTSATDENGRKTGPATCPVRPRPWVPADYLEEEVLGQLFHMFGNPSVIVEAVHRAVPDHADAVARRDRLTDELTKIDRSRARVLDLVVKDLVSSEQAQKELEGLKDRERTLKGELEGIAQALAEVPDEEALRLYVQEMQTPDGGTSILVYDDEGEFHPGGNDVATLLEMTTEHKKELLRAVFGSPLPGGAPAGVYVHGPAAGSTPHRKKKKWAITLKGRLWFQCVMQNVNQVLGNRHSELPAPPFVLPLSATG